MKIKLFGLVLGLVIASGAGLLAAESRFSTNVDSNDATEWQGSVDSAEGDPQIGSPVGSVVGGTGAGTSLSPATMQAISAEMPQGQYDVSFKNRSVNTGGHGMRSYKTSTYQTCDKMGACTTHGGVTVYEYRRCTRTIVYKDAYVNGTKVGSEQQSSSYRITTGWSTSTTYKTGTRFSQCG